MDHWPFMTTSMSDSSGAKEPMEHIQIKELVDFIDRALADNPSQAQVSEITGSSCSKSEQQKVI